MALPAYRPWDEGLQGVARRIAETNASPLRVLAGPGTGKSFSLMRRVARLLQTGADPSRMLVCTFTRTAAQDLKKDLATIGMEQASAVPAGTLHALCFSLLSKNHVLQLTGRHPRPLLKFEEKFLLEDLTHPDFGGVRKRGERLSAFNAAWARRQTEDPGWPADAVDRHFQGDLLLWLRFHESILIGEIVPVTLHYLHNNPLSEERHLFDHVLVDEYQDLNRAEQDLISLLAENANLTIVGDEDQSIYSFKYAYPHGIAEFNQHHPDTQDENLTDCRRCPRRVVSMANYLIANNHIRTNRQLDPLPENPDGNVYVLQWSNLEEEAQGIAQFINVKIQTNEVAAGNVLVLAPRQRLGKLICDSLRGFNIPVHSFYQDTYLDGNPKRLDQSQAQQALSLLTLLAKPTDRVALRCLCGFGSDTLNREPWQALRDHCQATGLSPFDALDNISGGRLAIPGTEIFVEQFRFLRQRLHELVDLQGQPLVDALFPPNQEWAESFYTMASQLAEEQKIPAQLYETVHANLIQPELPTNVNYVRVMSLYKSKGLTADLVIITGCIQGLIPTPPDTNLPLDIQVELGEEQRRLFYVGITRTRQALVLSSVVRIPSALAYRIHVPVITPNRQYTDTIASPYILELGTDCPHPIAGQDFLQHL